MKNKVSPFRISLKRTALKLRGHFYIILYFYHSDCSLVAKLALKSAQVVFNYLVVCHCYLPLALFSLGKAKL